jgi:hypothetical protein
MKLGPVSIGENKNAESQFDEDLQSTALLLCIQ